jgi:alanine racemase
MRPTKILIDVNALRHNTKIVKDLTRNAKLVAMVKGNAYGHGLSIVTEALQDKVDYFGVAIIDEAVCIREIGIKTPILLAEGFFNQEELYWIEANTVDTVIHSSWQVETLLATPLKKPIRVWLKFDSGMHRLGFHKDGFLKAFQALTRCRWVKNPMVLMTHLASAAKRGDSQTKSQLSYFTQVTSSLPGPKSIANSAAICSLSPGQNDIVRPGIMLYGGSPLIDKTPKELGLKPVMEYTTEVIVVRECQKGKSVGYDATWISDKKSLIATLPVGYADGYPRHIDKDVHVLIRGQKAPVVGHVSMDMLTVDVTHIEGVKRGDKVTLWGRKLPCHEVASRANTIDYDLFCRASMRVTPEITPQK